MHKDLKLKPLAIGSLPHKNVEEAMEIVVKNFSDIPFFPQLANFNKNENMVTQFLEGMPAFNPETPQDFCFDTDSEKFYEELENFYTNYECIVSKNDSELLETYAISENFSSTFPYFEDIIKQTKPKFAKGQITGPFTFCTSIKNNNGELAIYDDTLRDIIVKHLILKALWQIKRVKSANPATLPIIFMDEPSISQIGTSAYLSISEDLVAEMLKEVSDVIKQHGAISAIHCCGKCDWRIPIKTGIDIINFDAYLYGENFGIYHKEIKNFLQQGGKIAWGLIPTCDENLLANVDIETFEDKFFKSVKYLTKNQIDEKLIIENSLITSSCGAGSLSIEGAKTAMDLVFGLAQSLEARF